MKLICTWHVDKNWKENLKEKIKNLEKRAQVYKTLRVLLQECLESDFEKEVEGLKTFLFNDPETIAFGNYFVKYYCGRPEMWAYCHRLRAGINTNMHLEAMHKTVKYCYLDGKKPKRMDKTIEALMNLVRDKLFSRLIKLMKNTPPCKVREIDKSHKKSLEISTDEIEKRDEKWLVESSKKKHFYEIEKISEPCPQAIKKSLCPLTCTKCKICIHTFKCSCIDNSIKYNICKHIHAVWRLESATEISNVHGNFTNEDKMINILASIAPPPSENEERNYNQSLIQKAHRLIEVFSHTQYSEEENLALNKKMDSLLNECNKGRNFIEKENCNPRSNIEHQKRFVSTKKKRKSNSTTMSKPEDNEFQEIKKSLLSKNEEILLIQTASSTEHTYVKLK